MKKLLILIIAAGVVYLNYNNPTREDHEALIYQEMKAVGPITDEQFAQTMKNVDFSNFMICSATKTALDSRMITFGYLKKVELKNPGWVQENARKLLGRQGD